MVLRLIEAIDVVFIHTLQEIHKVPDPIDNPFIDKELAVLVDIFEDDGVHSQLALKHVH